MNRCGVLSHQISLSAVLWARASASICSPSAVNLLPINLQTKAAAECPTGPRHRWQECGLLPTRGGSCRCWLALVRPSVALLHRSSHFRPTCRGDRTGRKRALVQTRSVCGSVMCWKQSGRLARISGVCYFLSALPPETSHLEMWCCWPTGWNDDTTVKTLWCLDGESETKDLTEKLFA